MRSYVIVKYSRPWNFDSPNNTTLKPGGTYVFSYCFNPNSTTMVSHGPYKQSFTIQLAAGKRGFLVSSKASGLVWTHGVVLTLGWCLMSDIAILMKFSSSSYKIHIHAFIMSVVMLMTFVVTGLVMDKEPPKFS